MKFIHAIFALIILSSCEKETCFHGTGRPVNQVVETGAFNRIEVRGLFDILLSEDTACYLEMEGGRKDLDFVFFENRDSALILNNKNSCPFLRDYSRVKLIVHYSRLDRLDIFDVSYISSNDSLQNLKFMTVQSQLAEVRLLLNSNHFGFYNNRTTGGLYSFEGKIDRAWISGFYSAKFATDKLFVRDFYVHNSSLSDMYVNATEKLHVSLSHRGNIYYSGSPQITIDSITSQGQLLPWTE